MGKRWKLLVLVLAVVLFAWVLNRFSDVLVEGVLRLWNIEDPTLDKINKWTGILADGGAVLAVVGSIVLAVIYWPWRKQDALLDAGNIKVDRNFLGEYRRHVVDTYKYLDFKGIDDIPEAMGNTSGLLLESVFVPLQARLDLPSGESWHRVGGRLYRSSQQVVTDTDEGLKTEQEAKTVEQWINEQQALVVLGDPGSGKSTSLKHLALTLAQSKNGLLPILLPLNAYAKALEQHPVSFEAFLPEYFHGKLPQLSLVKLQALFTEALQQQKAFVLLDGLDEVGENRGKVVAQVECFVRTWVPDPSHQDKQGKNRIVVTSRFVGYQEHPLGDVRWKTVAINDWNLTEISQFFEKFTLAAEKAWAGGESPLAIQEKAGREQRALLAVVQENEGIQRLAGNPLLSSMLALIKRQGVNLPDRRVELYKLYMGTLLRSWNRARNLDNEPVGPKVDFSATQRLLAKLALHVRQTNPQSGLISESDMRHYLREHFRTDGYEGLDADQKADGFFDSAHKYSSLLVERGYQQYGFIHLTFEEYLAGLGLSLEKEDMLYTRVVEYLQNPTQWQETLLLALGVVAVSNSDQEKANAVLGRLLASGDARHSIFAGQVLRDVGAAALGNRMSTQIQGQLVGVMRDAGVGLEQRAEAGQVLGEVGDPRKGVGVITAGSHKGLPDIDWVQIPAGTFRMGTEGEEGYEDEKPAHTVSLAAFQISRYPVTNAQFRAFIEAGGYETERYWHTCEAAYHWWQGGKPDLSLLDDKPDWKKAYENWLAVEPSRRQPWFWEERHWNNPNHPVVGVSWYEVLAFCAWLNEQSLVDGKIRLPSEAEWEYAARGKDAWRYAWGNEPDPSLGNYTDTGLGRTSAVGLFPAGKAFGLYDITGNVWEWTSSQWGKQAGHPDFTYTQPASPTLQDDVSVHALRIIRGGSWDDYFAHVRCAVRSGFLPYSRNSLVGFRLCAFSLDSAC